MNLTTTIASFLYAAVQMALIEAWRNKVSPAVKTQLNRANNQLVAVLAEQPELG